MKVGQNALEYDFKSGVRAVLTVTGLTSLQLLFWIPSVPASESEVPASWQCAQASRDAEA